MTRKLSAAGAAAAVILLLAGAAAAQRQDDGKGAAQGMPMPDMSGIQQQMQARMMQQMTQQMQSASPAVQMPGAQAAAGQPVQQQGMMPDMGGIQQQMQARMMQQMTQQAAPAAGLAAQGVAPDGMMRQNMQQQMQKVLGMNQPAPAGGQNQSGGIQIDAALAALKMDPAVQAAINQKMMKIMEQTMQETFADPKMRQEMQQRFMINSTAPSQAQQP